MDKIRERVSRRLRPAAANPGEASEDCLGLGEVDVGELAAVAAVPAQSGPLESDVSASSRSRRSSRGVS
jgi:hypothetical protein